MTETTADAVEVYPAAADAAVYDPADQPALPPVDTTTYTAEEIAQLAAEQTGQAPGDVFVLDVDDIRYAQEDNQRWARHTEGDIRARAKSIQEYGQLAPCGVVPLIDADGVLRWRLVWGALRFLAVSWLVDQSPGTCLLRVEWWNGDPSKVTATNIKENADRVNLTAMDRSVAINRLKAEGKSGRDIAKIMGCDAGLVSKLGRLTSLPPEAQEAVHLGVVPQTVAVNWASLDGDDRDKVIAKQLRKLIATGDDDRPGKAAKQGKAKRATKKGTKVSDLAADAAETTGKVRARTLPQVLEAVTGLLNAVPHGHSMDTRLLLQTIMDCAAGDSSLVDNLLTEWGVDGRRMPEPGKDLAPLPAKKAKAAGKKTPRPVKAAKAGKPVKTVKAAKPVAKTGKTAKGKK